MASGVSITMTSWWTRWRLKSPASLRRCKSKKTSKLRVTGLCERNSPVTSEFPTQRASNGEMFPFDDVIVLLIIYRKSWHFQQFDLLSKCQHISPSTATSSDYNSNQVHPDTQMRSGCVEMIYPGNNDLWWHNGTSRGRSRCCECYETRTGIYLWSLSCWIYSIMMTSSHEHIFQRHWHFVGGIHRSPVNSPHKCQWRGALMFSLICVWINGWVDNREVRLVIWDVNALIMASL